MPQIVVLDTHIWFWWITKEFERFPSLWLDVIESADRVAVSPVSCYEIALSNQRGRLTLPCDPAEWLHDALAPAGIELLPISAAIAIRAIKLSPIHKDPFDRIIIASALEHQARLASVDSLFPHYPELESSLLQS
ncbi:MAG: PIN domain-containing protein [Methylomonas sp.]|jgi:PIN domain nuclease of toxin-antitoxin system